MPKQLITLFFFFCFFTFSANSANCKCQNFVNRIFQTTNTLPGLKPFYSLLTLLPNGIAFETVNIAGGQSVAEIGLEIKFNVHSGYYECLPDNVVRVIVTSYLYKVNETEILRENGALGVHEYKLQFLNHDNRQCTGVLQYALYKTGTNPTDSNNAPVFTSPIANLTGVYINRGGLKVMAD